MESLTPDEKLKAAEKEESEDEKEEVAADPATQDKKVCCKITYRERIFGDLFTEKEKKEKEEDCNRCNRKRTRNNN